MKSKTVKHSCLWLGLCLALVGAGPLAGGSFEVSGFVDLQGALADGAPSWRDGGFGRLESGGEPGEDSSSLVFGDLHLLLDWRPDSVFGAFLHATARTESEDRDGEAGGIVEAYLRADVPVRLDDSLRFRLGHFLLPTSRENVEPGWSSPYTLTLSALNTWIGQELRPTGLLVDYDLALAGGNRLRLGGSAFGGNDTAGASLAWRGWALGDRLSVFGETLPLPPIRSLSPGGVFAGIQNPRGTTPFDRDLDDRIGWAGYVRGTRPGKAMAQWTHVDNRADRGLHGDEYAWYTSFDLAALELHPSERLTLAGELLFGETSMGERVGPRVEAEIETAYLLASLDLRPLRLSLRYDTFTTRDLDLSAAEANDDDGSAWTLALLWHGPRGLRLGLEYVDLEAERAAAAEVGLAPDTDSRSLLFELRYTFEP